MENSRRTPPWHRAAVALVLLLTVLLAFDGGGGVEVGNSESAVARGDGAVPVLEIASCEGDIFIQTSVEDVDPILQSLTLLGLTVSIWTSCRRSETAGR